MAEEIILGEWLRPMAFEEAIIGYWDTGDRPLIQRAWLSLRSPELVNPNKEVKAICRVLCYHTSNNHIYDCEIIDDKLWIVDTDRRKRGKWLDAVNEGEVIESLLRQATEWSDDG
ncbi:MAG: hypothetical protein QF535_22335 [Anaerolineales bacterium]|jgi:hypothetical protein|nr:hypothetical protein [Anaerolineales bacterium]